MSYWNAKYTNEDGEYEITFASQSYDKAKAVEKVCAAVIDKKVDAPDDIEIVVRCKDCKHWEDETDELGEPGGYCKNPDGLDNFARPNDFCSYGERKDNV